ncbi:YbaB/EbfC family nucleoid-associated protein [Sciscionella marina]|uniref:YbaB/EbfC family nucleoid-associated protein n=1 Tax=Sciscionella marina TaxID=508770 RepID=UPI000364B4C8|nr:YbaB/EbfC family nucleoid-associated protein [Sciscionella marina]
MTGPMEPTGPRPGMRPDAMGYLPNGRPTTERLVQDAEERLERAEKLPEALASIRGWAVNEPETITVTVNNLGELVDIDIAEIVLTADPTAIGEQIVRLAAEAHRAAQAEGLGVLAPVVGDAQVLELAREAGLTERVEPDAPVVPHEDGILTPGSALEPEPVHGDTSAPGGDWQDDEADISQFDFSRFRSDR